MATEIINQEKIDKAFTHLTTHKTLLTNCIDQWTNLNKHFTALDESITQKSKTLDTKLETLDTDLKKALDSLDDREKSIPEQEPLLTARVNELKEVALGECEKKVSGKGGLEELVKGYCRKMDAVGLLKYMASRRKEGDKLRGYLPDAVKEAVDQQKFVLDAVRDYVGRKETKVGLAERRFALSVMLMAVFPAKERRLPVAKSLGEKAGSLAEEWKAMIENEQGDGTNGHVDGGVFLYFVVGFGVFSRFEKEYLRKLIVQNSTPKYVRKIVSALGFGDDEIGDIIDDLLKRDKEIDALNFACECGLTERFDPVKLLQTYLNKARERAQKLLKDGNFNSSATTNANISELNALRAIIKCVEENKIKEFHLEGVKERAAVLEKSKPDKKGGFNKRTRGGGADSRSINYHPTKFGRGSSSYSYDRRNPGPPHQSRTAAYEGSYRYPPSEAAYGGPPSGTYNSRYGAHSRIPAALPPPEGLGAAGAQGSYGAQTSYGAYM